MGKKLGDASDPLLLSVRSGAKFSMPGMMNTILNLGLNDKTRRRAWPRTAPIRASPTTVIAASSRCSAKWRSTSTCSKFDHIFDERKKKVKAKLDTDLSAEDLKAIIGDYQKLVKKETGKPFPQDAREQLAMSRDAVFRSWWGKNAVTYRRMEKIPDDLGTAANVQAMVFGNLGDTSGTGVGFTRNPATGEKVFWGEFLLNAQGEDVVAGIRTPQPIADLEAIMPDAYRQLRDITSSLEKHYRDMQDFEFTIENGKLFMLQTRNGKRTGAAALRVAVEMVKEGLIDKKEAVLRVAPQQLDQLLHPLFDQASLKTLTKIANGIDASPGAAVGRAVFTPMKRSKASRRAR